MSDFIKKIPTKIINFFSKMEKGKRKSTIVFISIIFAVILIASVLLNQTSYSVLYSGMDSADAGEVLGLLSEMGIDAKTKGEDTILVAESEVDTVRLELAAKGYPSSGFNYDIYELASGLGVTDEVKQRYYQFQLQENIRQTIVQLYKVEDAVVNLDLGEDSSFVLSDDEDSATASVVLVLEKGEELDSGEVTAITQLVSKSISGLETENVSIIDSNMNLYSTEEKDNVKNVDSQLELKMTVQNQFEEQIVNLLSPVLGAENVLAVVSAALNFDTKVTESIEYSSPNDDGEGIVVSMQELIEAISNNSEGSASGIDANGSASDYLSSLDDDEDSVYYQISREANYEINETITQVEKARGEIEDLSVSVILNSEYDIDDYSDEIKQLISTAIGAQEDKINVEMLPFKVNEETAVDSAAVALQAQQELLETAQAGSTQSLIIVCVCAVIIFILILAMVKSLRKKTPKEGWEEGFELVADEEIIPDGMTKETNLEDFDQKDGNLSVLEEYVNKNPESVANLLRNWLNNE